MIPHSTTPPPASEYIYVQLSRNSELSAFEFLWRLHYIDRIDQLTHQTHPEVIQKLRDLSQLLSTLSFPRFQGVYDFGQEGQLCILQYHDIRVVYHSLSVSWPASLSQRQGWRWEGHS